MPLKKNHFEKQKRNLQLSLNIPFVPFGKREKKGKNSPHSTPPHPTSETTPHKKGEKNSTLPSSLFKLSPLNPSTQEKKKATPRFSPYLLSWLLILGPLYVLGVSSHNDASIRHVGQSQQKASCFSILITDSPKRWEFGYGPQKLEP